MSSSSIEFNTTHQIRSFSLPSNSNLINKRIEEELERLKIKEASVNSAAESISIGLSGLSDLYLCINQVLCLPVTQQALSLRHHEKGVGELLKVCSNLQSFSCTMKELVGQQKKLTEDLISALSAKSADYEIKLARYVSSRKEVIKRSKELIRSLNQVVDDAAFGSSSLFQKDQRLCSVIKAITCVSIINASVYESLSFFLSSPVAKQSIGSLVSKLIHNRSSKKSGNQLTDVDRAIQSLSSRFNGDKVQHAQQRLEDLMGVMQGIEKGLDNACSQLAETKACLANIVSF